jgi:hypothetical protein
VKLTRRILTICTVPLTPCVRGSVPMSLPMRSSTVRSRLNCVRSFLSHVRVTLQCNPKRRIHGIVRRTHSHILPLVDMYLLNVIKRIMEPPSIRRLWPSIPYNLSLQPHQRRWQHVPSTNHERSSGSPDPITEGLAVSLNIQIRIDPAERLVGPAPWTNGSKRWAC